LTNGRVVYLTLVQLVGLLSKRSPALEIKSDPIVTLTCTIVFLFYLDLDLAHSIFMDRFVRLYSVFMCTFVDHK